MKKITKIKTMLLLLLTATWTQVVAQQDFFTQEKVLTATDIVNGKTIAIKGISETNTQWINCGSGSTSIPINTSIYSVEATSGSSIVLKRNDNKYIGVGDPIKNTDGSISGYAMQFVEDKTNAAVFTTSTPAFNDQNTEGSVSGIHEVLLPNMTGEMDSNTQTAEKQAILATSWANGKQIRFTTVINGTNYYLNIQTSGTGIPRFANGKGSWSIVMAYNAEGYNAPSSTTITLKLIREDGTEIDQREISSYIGASISVPSLDFRRLLTVKNGETDVTLNNNQEFTVAQGMGEIVCTYADALTFNTTTITNGEFAPETEWYQLSIHNTSNRAYFKYDESSKTVIPVKAGNQNVYDETQLWCFTGSLDEGVKVYNKAAGTSLCMTYNPDNVSMTENGSIWTLKKTRLTTAGFENAFCLRNSDTYINYDATKNKIAYWGDNDDGSAIIAWSYEDYVTNTAETMRTYTTLPVGTVGTPKAGFEAVNTAIDAFEANPNKETETAVYTALNTDLVEFSANSYYRIMTTGRNAQHYMTAGSSMSGSVLNNANASQIWKFEANGENYKFTSQNVYTTTPAQSQTVNTTEDSNAAQTFSLNRRADNYAQYAITPVLETGTAYELHLAGGLNIVGWNGGGASSWYLIPASEIDVTITEAGYATINYPFAVELPAGLTAFTGTINGEKVELNKVNGNVVPANSPVILAGDADTYTLTILADNTDEALTSDLEGTLLPQTIDAIITAYVLAKPEAKEVGFYLLESGEGANRTIGANKAYLTITNPADIKAFTFDFGGTTGIDNPETAVEAEEYYDLQGRRVINPTKGIYVTKSGKKVLFTK